ncbi:MAG TPA: MltA domain-containing protein [Sedimentisphaerales bacterium]|nr:MltA domain-containing protein [Sedimentisphaerales bacterium]HQG47815.1 MltA domain-containing protein [Sedimentisphaerales bacterium]
MKKLMLLGLLVSGVVLTGCQTKRVTSKPQYDRPLPPGQLALRKIDDPSRYPDFTRGWRDLDTLKAAIRNSLNYLSKASSKQHYPYGQITHDQAVASLQAFLSLLDSGARADEINALIAVDYDVYESVGCDDLGTVLFTGYYTPIFNGSYEQTDTFRYPLYKVPPDLVKDADGQTLGRRWADGKLAPYPSRAEIEVSGMLKGQELIWLSDPFEVYIAHVQGSAKIRLPDGRIVTVGYAANNGHDYVSVAAKLVADGKIASDHISLATMIEYFKAHPEDVDTYVRMNPRFVFFQSSEGTPRGSLNEPVIPWRTIATDKSIFPRGCLAFLSTTLPQVQDGRMSIQAFEGFALDQDTGGAIRAAGRCDIYMGEGDEAGQLAGQTYQEGRLYYLFAKPQVAATESLTPTNPDRTGVN